jgi:hypothetical protein
MASDRDIRFLARLQEQGRTETLTCRPPGAATFSRQALVDRKAPTEYGHGAAPVIEISMLNDATHGIAASAMVAGSYQIDVAERVGAAAAARTVHRIVPEKTDDDWLVFEVR